MLLWDISLGTPILLCARRWRIEEYSLRLGSVDQPAADSDILFGGISIDLSKINHEAATPCQLSSGSK